MIFNLIIPCSPPPADRVSFDSLSPMGERVRVRGIRIDILLLDTPSAGGRLRGASFFLQKAALRI
jgi:hypothetical protein